MPRNEYGIELDRNGYAPSIISNERRCYRCRRTDGKIDRHEVYHGPNRTRSKNLGCWVYLCHGCHMDLHNTDPDFDAQLKIDCEDIALNYYGWSTSDFRRNFGKNYLI